MKSAADSILKGDQAAYLAALEPARDALLAEMEAAAAKQGQPISDPEVASFLTVTARAMDAKHVVELGTNIGYGAIVLARAASHAKVVTFEKSADIAKTARGYIDRAGLSARVEVREGDALEGIRTYSGPIDLLYVDCVKEDYVAYLEAAVPKLSERGVVIADNVMWRGFVAAKDVPDGEKKRVDALRAFNRMLVGDARLRGVVLPLGDGVGYAVRV